MKVVVFDRMEECTEAEVRRMLPLVSAQRRDQALRYKHTFGQYCCLKSWLMLYETMANGEWANGEWANGEWANGEWLYNEHGKPYIENGPYFSISHCKEGIAVAMDDQPIGIDIEAIRHAEPDLIERTMNEEEKSKVERQKTKDESDRMFTRLWTQKEAIVKAEGVGIVSFEQLQGIGHQPSAFSIQTIDKEKYIYSIAHK